MHLESRQAEVAQIKRECIDFGLHNLDPSSNMQEEQERELAPEIEQEGQIERPPPRSPANHVLYPDVKFAVTVVMTPNSTAFMPAFKSLAKSSAAKHFRVSEFPSDLLVTTDFARTVKPDANASISAFLDPYHRHVQWILTQAVDESVARHGMRMVIVSSWEANKLKARLEALEAADLPSPPVFLRAYLPRSSLSFRTLEDLTAYTIPSSSSALPPPPPLELVDQLNLFAGQPYLRSYAHYERVCRYLGLSYTESNGDNDLAADGFVGREWYEDCEFEKSPMAFLAVLYKRIRKDCMNIEKTHLGRIFAGEILSEKDSVGVESRVEMQRKPRSWLVRMVLAMMRCLMRMRKGPMRICLMKRVSCRGERWSEG